MWDIRRQMWVLDTVVEAGGKLPKPKVREAGLAAGYGDVRGLGGLYIKNNGSLATDPVDTDMAVITERGKEFYEKFKHLIYDSPDA